MRRIKGLNRREFKKNLKQVLKPEYAQELPLTFEDWVTDYERQAAASGVFGWYEVKAAEHRRGHSQQIKTN